MPPQNHKTNEKLFRATNSSIAACNKRWESDWKVSDFLLGDDSCDEWLPCRLLLRAFVFTLTKMTFVTNKITFTITKDGLF